MKSTFNKKLSLNKKTVANLNNREMRAAKGGIESMDPGTTCNWDDTCPETCRNSCDCFTNWQWCTLSCGDSCLHCVTDYC